MGSEISVPFVPGPSFWYVNTLGTNEARTFDYLGQVEGDTDVSLSPEWEDVYVDGSGARIPYDRQFMGATGSVSGNLVFYREPVLQALGNWLNDTTRTPGTFPDGTVGTLARTEGFTFELIIKSLYAGNKAVFSGNGAVPAYWFKWAVPVGQWSNPLSARATRKRVSFDCLPIWDLNGGGVLYTTDISGVTLPGPT